MSDNKIEKEIRFAVVMYGGGSLAIYINGIAQELLKMVRSTAKDRSVDKAFDGTEKVYRQIALLLSDEKLLEDFTGLNEPEQIELELNRLVKTAGEKASQRIPETQAASNFDEPSVRFVIDVITGSSAGGINGVFLSKALANNQEIERLKQLWLDEGDFNKLLNDKYSITNEVRQLKKPTEPVSLLNSQRMYFKLLAALDSMSDDNSSDESEQKQASPNAEEIDLFVTVTHFAGVSVRIRLFDRVVTERRHKQYFHFKYGKRQPNGNWSQFTKKYNPFLAFAARSTISLLVSPLTLCSGAKPMFRLTAS
jgi:patatin-related protein